MDVEVSNSKNDTFKEAAWWFVFGGVTLFIYLLKRFFRGRAQVRRNCDLIGKQLEHLQRIIEENERKEKEKQLKEGGEDEVSEDVIVEDTPEEKKDK